MNFVNTLTFVRWFPHHGVMLILIRDLGATNCRLAFFEANERSLRSVHRARIRFAGSEDLLEVFAARALLSVGELGARR